MTIGYHAMHRTNCDDGIIPERCEYEGVAFTRATGGERLVFPPSHIIIEPRDKGRITLDFGDEKEHAEAAYNAIVRLRALEGQPRAYEILGKAECEHFEEDGTHKVVVSNIVGGNGLMEAPLWNDLLPPDALQVMRHSLSAQPAGHVHRPHLTHAAVGTVVTNGVAH